MAQRWLALMVVVAALFGPHQALAAVVILQPAGSSAAAPTLGGPLLAVLSLSMAIGAFVLLRRRSAKVAALAASLILMAAVGYTQPPQVVVTGSDCSERSIHPYDGDVYGTILRSECPNPMQIVEVDPECQEGVTPRGLSGCKEGDVLQQGDSCRLPACID